MRRSTRQDTVPAVILMAAATLFTVGRSIIVARDGMRLTPPAEMAASNGQRARVVTASNGPDMNAINHELGGGGAMKAAEVEPSPLSPPPVPAQPVRPRPAATAETDKPKPPRETLRLTGISSDFAILHDGNGDHSLRIGSRLGRYTLRQITGSSVILESDTGESITLGLSRADH